VAIYGTGGFHADATGRTNAGVMASRKTENLTWDFSVFKGAGIVSDNQHHDDPIQNAYNGNTNYSDQNLGKVSNADPMNINLGLKYKDLYVRTMYDEFKTSDPLVNVSFKSFFADLRYTWKIKNKFRLTPQLKFIDQRPWTYGPKENQNPDFEAQATRVYAQADGEYNASRKTSINFGAIYFRDHGDYETVLSTFAGDRSLTLSNYALYAQALFKHRLANATIGFRYEKNNRYGGAFVPRLALTKKIENFHFKILYSQAFRAPSLQNINIALNGKIKPEKSDVFELELGYQFTPEMLLAVNAFSISTRNLMIYSSEGEDESFKEWYENSRKSGSKGIEVVYSIRRKVWYAHLTYSFSQAIKSNTVETYEVSQTNRQYVGFPAHKITLNTNFNLTSKLSFNPTFIYAGKRYAYTQVDADGNAVSTSLNPYLLSNAFLNYRNLLPGLTAGVGVYDIFNRKPAIPQAYNGGYAPIPGRSREYVVKLSYQLNFSK
jgi:outer membrane cobalamin receptor